MNNNSRRHSQMRLLCLLVTLLPQLISCGLNQAEYNRLRAAGDWTSALEVARGWVKADPYMDPYIAKTVKDRVMVRQYALDAITNYVATHGPSRQLDQEAKQYFVEGLQASSSDEHKAMFNRMYGQYLQASGYMGRSLPYLREARDQAGKVTNIFNMILSDVLIANAYRDIGQYALEEQHRQEALQRAKKYFRLGALPTDEGEWFGYRTLLMSHIDFFARKQTSSRIMDLWEILEPISEKHAHASNIDRSLWTGYILPAMSFLQVSGQQFHVPQASSQIYVARMLARAGDLSQSKQLFQIGIRTWEQERGQHPTTQQAIERSILCAEGEIYFYAEEYDLAIQKLEECKSLRQEEGPSPHFTLYQKLGKAYENTHSPDQAFVNYKKSVELSEQLRRTFDIQERTAFFRSEARSSYWGLIRLLAKRALKTSDRADLFEALEVTELTRARQLGEIIEKKHGMSRDIDEMDRLQSVLQEEDVVLDYMYMDREILLFAITKHSWHIQLIPIDTNLQPASIRALAEQLATPKSNIVSIEEQLLALSQQLLSPAQNLLDRKSRLYVLLDGPLQLIPFETLSSSMRSYSPLIHEWAVVSPPSLAIFMKATIDTPTATAVNGFYGVGDPTYPKFATLPPLPETRSEIDTIAKLFTSEPVKIIYGNKARESAIKHGELNKYSYVHFATHGLLAGELPGVAEPALVLAEEETQDGFLRASEARRLRLKARLTVLSACKTGTGEYVTGEGVMGIGRAFLLAGSQSVVVSLWSVDSQATVEFMIAFYNHIKQGLPHIAALRLAKLDMFSNYKRGKGYAANRGIDIVGVEDQKPFELHPFFWAPFILVGS